MIAIVICNGILLEVGVLVLVFDKVIGKVKPLILSVNCVVWGWVWECLWLGVGPIVHIFEGRLSKKSISSQLFDLIGVFQISLLKMLVGLFQRSSSIFSIFCDFLRPRRDF